MLLLENNALMKSHKIMQEVGLVQHPFWHNLFRRSVTLESTIADLWLNTALFDRIARRHCETMVPNMQLRQYGKGEVIFNQGDLGIGVVMILSGSVSISSNGNQLALLSKGDFFGEVALVSDEPRTADAFADQDSELVFFLRPHLIELLEQHPPIASQLMLNLARVLASRLRASNDMLNRTPDSEL